MKFISITKPCIRFKKVRHMNYLASFLVIGVKGLLHSEWLGTSPAASPIGPQLGEGKTGKSGTPPF
jgi:hypothetical protein